MRGEVREWLVQEVRMAVRSWFRIFLSPPIIAVAAVISVCWMIYSHYQEFN